MKEYYLFLDESGHHGLKTLNQEFPLLVIAGIAVEKEYYESIFTDSIEFIKKKFFHSTNIVFHSRDIRKWQGDFKILFDPSLRQDFYNDLNKFLRNSNITIIASAILKDQYLELFGTQASDPYHIALSFILEKSVYFAQSNNLNAISLIAESRGRKEDKDLQTQFQMTITNGTKSIKASEFINIYQDSIKFIRKSENNLGTQIADLVAYPISQKILYPDRVNVSFEILENKLYRSLNEDDPFDYGFKIYPKK